MLLITVFFLSFFVPLQDKVGADISRLPISFAEYVVKDKAIHIAITKNDVPGLLKQSIEVVMNDRFIKAVTVKESKEAFDLYFYVKKFKGRNYVEITASDGNTTLKGTIYFTRPFIPKNSKDQPVVPLTEAKDFHPFFYIAMALILLLSIIAILFFIKRRRHHQPHEAYLVSENQGEMYCFKGRVSIGRSSKNDIVINHESVSAMQCVITEKNNQYVIKDQNSSNVTMVNQQKAMKEIRLKHRDIITMGELTFQFLMKKKEK